jgi:hypothetical protein
MLANWAESLLVVRPAPPLELAVVPLVGALSGSRPVAAAA